VTVGIFLEDLEQPWKHRNQLNLTIVTIIQDDQHQLYSREVGSLDFQKVKRLEIDLVPRPGKLFDGVH
jgi:hypothetical protein